MTRKKYKGK